MTVVLVLFTLILFLTADRIVLKVRERRALASVPAMAGAADSYGPRIPDGTAIALNHTWFRNEGNGIIAVGLDEFIGRLAGTAEAIGLPAVGADIGTGGVAMTLRVGNKMLTFGVPFSGRIVKLNRAALRKPVLSADDPYGEGWLLKIRCAAGELESGAAKRGRDAVDWLTEQSMRAREFLLARGSASELAVAMDGGSLSPGVLKTFDAEVWKDFQREFVPSTASGQKDQRQ